MRKKATLGVFQKYPVLAGLWLVCLWMHLEVHAQRFPVQVTQAIIPPYSTKLSAYTTAMDVKMRVNLLMTDITVGNKPVRLALRIKGNGFDIRSTEQVVGAPPIYLTGGMMQQFTNIDLKAYFEPQNLIGLQPYQYRRPLPEGFYTFSWEVYDLYTNQQLNHPTSGGTSIYIMLNDPPFLNLPDRGDLITEKFPSNIIFQWTPRHTNAPNVSYEFEIRQLWDNEADPQTAFLTAPNYHKETTYTTTFLYDAFKPVLLPNIRYGWRVRAVSKTGLDENALFKNDGYSEIYYFTYTGQCHQPNFILSENLSKDRVKITWQGNPEHRKYHVQYKRSDIVDAEWFEVKTYNTEVQISNLREGKTYDFRVGGSCQDLREQDQAYVYSQVQKFTMPKRNEMGSSYNCGIVPEIEITSDEPIEHLAENETFTAGDFPVTIKWIRKEGMGFTGTGFITVPYLRNSRIMVVFENIQVNTDYQLMEGMVRTTYDEEWNQEPVVEAPTDNTGGDVADSDTKDDTKGDPQDETKDDTKDETTDSEETDDDTVVDADTDTTPEDSDGEDHQTNDETTDDSTSEEGDTPSGGNTVTEGTPGGGGGVAPGTGGGSPSDTDSDTDEEADTSDLLMYYKGKTYRHQEEIAEKYQRNKALTLSLKEVDSDAKIEWTLHSDFTNTQSDRSLGTGQAVTFSMDDIPASSTVQAEYWSPASEYPKGKSKRARVGIVVVRKEFRLTQIKVKDVDNKDRFAKNGQTLYYVGKTSLTGSRKVAYTIWTNPKVKESEVAKQDITWEYDSQGVSQSDIGKKSMVRTLKERKHAHTVKVTAGNPQKKSKEVKVVFVDRDERQVDIMPPGLNFLLKDKFEKINQNLKKLDNIIRKLGIADDPKTKVDPIRISGKRYNEEDENSRFYKKNEQGSVSGGIKTELAEISFTHPVFKLTKKLKVLDVGAYLLFKFQVQLKGGIDRYRLNGHKDYKGKERFIKVSAKGCIEAGLKAELMALKDKLDFKAKGYVEGCVVGELQYKFDKKKFIGKVFIPPVILAAQIKIKSKGVFEFELVDWRGKVAISDELPFTGNDSKNNK